MPAPAFLRRRWVWVAVGTPLAAVLLVVGILAFPALVLRAVNHHVAARTGQRITFADARWASDTTFTVGGVQVADAKGTVYFAAKRLSIGWNWFYLFRDHRLSLIEAEQPELFVSKMLAAFPDAGKGGASDASGDDGADPIETLRHLVYRFRIVKGIVWLDNIEPGLPPLPLVLGRKAPLEWKTGSLTREDPNVEPLQIAEIDGVRLYSPIDPLVPVLDLGRISVTFTWEGLARREIASVAIERPTIYVGPGLFAFSDAVKSASARAATATVRPPGGAPAAAPSAPAVPAPAPAPAAAPREAKEWVLHDFVVDNGRLVITAFGEPGVKLPFTFRASAQALALNHLDQLSLHSAIVIQRQTYEYPSYGVKLADLEGEIQFSLPPQDAKANNLVQTIKVREASWKGIAVQNVASSVTFDRTGIYGSVWGKTYGGWITGDYFVRFNDGFPWHAGLYVTGAEVAEPIRILAGEHFALRGKMNATVTVDAKSRDIGKSEARVVFSQGGHMEIPSVDQVTQKLPADWEEWRRKILRKILESFRSYDFADGSLLLRYGLPTSTAQLNLEGSQGRRNFVLNWKQEGASAVRLPDQRPPSVSVKIDKNP
jgi:hypothetical protein